MRISRIAASVVALGCLLGAPWAFAFSPGAARRLEAGAFAGGQNSSRGAGRRLTVTGRLTGEGVECQAFRSKNGILYTLSGNLRGFREGDRVRVVGRVAEMSTCMQGTTLVVESIRRVKR